MPEVDDPGQPMRLSPFVVQGSALAVVTSISRQLEPVCTGGMAADQEAWWLLEAATGRSRTRLVADSRCVLDDTARRFVEYALIERVQKKKPIEYVLGAVAFCGFAFEVVEPVLIPRQETEEWVTTLVQELKAKIPSNARFSILDACTGSGCIGLVLAAAFPNATVLGVDISSEAVALAERNRLRFGLNNISFVQCKIEDFLEKTNKQFDIVVSNPPYLSQGEWPAACAACPSLIWESQQALVGGDDGLHFYRSIISQAKRVLSGGFAGSDVPQLVFEIGYAQGKLVKELAERAGFFATVKKDLAEKDRVVWCV